MKLNFTYTTSPQSVIAGEARVLLPLMKQAGLGTLNLSCNYYGGYTATYAELKEARHILLEEGLEAGAMNLPCGHGGNALDPDDKTVDLSIGRGWSMTMGRDGRWRTNTTCIDDVMITDMKAACELLRSLGFDTIWNDDDLRLGSWGPALQGCLCPRCVDEFSALTGRKTTREEIVSEKDADLSRAWMDYQCQKILRYLRETTPDGCRSGIMVMHNGDPRHGIDIPLLRRELPDNLIFRVGEGHFDDRSFEDPKGRESLRRSIRHHMTLVGDPDLCWSETTIYPMGALRPENWIEKIRVEIACGLRNIYLMGGSRMIEERYWTALRDALPELKERAESSALPDDDPEFTWDW